MKISTRGRYAIRVMLDLAEHNTGRVYSVDGYSKKAGDFREISGGYCGFPE